MVTKTVIQKPEIKDSSEYKINRRTREGKLLFSLLNKEQVRSAKLVKVIKRFDDGRTYEQNGVQVEWDTPLVISMARDINNHPNRTDKDVVNVVVTEMIQTEFSDRPEYVAYTTVSDEPQVSTINGNSYLATAFEKEALRRAVENDQVEHLRLNYLALERKRQALAEHEAKLAEAKAIAKVSEHDAYCLREVSRVSKGIKVQLAQPLETTPKALVERAKLILKQQLFEIILNNVGKPYCEITYRERYPYGKDEYQTQTLNDVVAYITTQWKSSDWGQENILDQIVVKEVMETLR